METLNHENNTTSVKHFSFKTAIKVVKKLPNYSPQPYFLS